MGPTLTSSVKVVSKWVYYVNFKEKNNFSCTANDGNMSYYV